MSSPTLQSPRTTATALLVIDIQLGLLHPQWAGTARSTPAFESNVAALLAAARAHNTSSSHPISIIHVHHHAPSPSSLLHPSHIITWSDEPHLHNHRGIEPLPCAAPHAGEPVLTKSVNSAFIGTPLEKMLRDQGIRQVLVCGMTTEHCVSTSVRMAGNLNVVGNSEGRGEEGVWIVQDACAAFNKLDGQGKEVWDAETVHRVNVECLRDEFCGVVDTQGVVRVVERDDMGEVEGAEGR